MIRFERDRNCLWLPPENAVSDVPLPTIVFLHGVGERGYGGEDLPRVALWGLPKRQVREQTGVAAASRSFLVVAPQCPPDQRWTDAEILHGLDHFVEDLKRDGSIDVTRLHVAGFSMGGIGAFALALRRPQDFASLISVCGTCEQPDRLGELAGLPVWLAWADDDEIEYLTEGSRQAATHLAAYGRLVTRSYQLGADGTTGAHARTADAAFAEPLLYAWMQNWRARWSP